MEIPPYEAEDDKDKHEGDKARRSAQHLGGKTGTVAGCDIHRIELTVVKDEVEVEVE